MRIEYGLKNYRCFEDAAAAALTISPGFTGLVGVNNAGKSTLLRSLYELRPLFNQLETKSGFYHAGSGGANLDLPLQGVNDRAAIFNDRNARDIEISIGLPDASRRILDIPVPQSMRLLVHRTSGRVTTSVTIGGETYHGRGFVQGPRGEPVLQFDSHAMCDVEPYQECFATLANSLYLGAFRNALNVGAGQPYYDLQVGQQFIAQWDAFKSGGSKEQRAQAVRVQRDLGAIFRLDDVELNASSDNQTLLVVIGDESYTLQELGSGFAQFLIVLAYVATRSPAIILIDEPELNLHPALQLDFLSTLTSLADFGVVFATHSVGLARAASDAIYSVRRLGQGRADVREFEATPALAELLGELSLSGYRELGFSTVVLVEGPSELRTIQRLLRLYRVEHQVVLVPLGGGSMIRAGVATALAEIRRLSESVFALVDSERASAEAELDRDRTGFVEACDEAGVTCHVLERRAIENYFPERAISEVKGAGYVALKPYERVKDAARPWSKTNDNWRIAGAMRLEDLDGTDLGTFFHEISAAVRAEAGGTRF